jgi:polyphosphate kinase
MPHHRLASRNESCFSIRQKHIKDRIKADLELFLADNSQAWILHGDGSYERLSPAEAEQVSAQDTFLQMLAMPSGS